MFSLFLASIRNKHGHFCPEKCQKNYACKTDNLVCPTCQEGWGGPYCHREFLLAVSNNLVISLQAVFSRKGRQIRF